MVTASELDARFTNLGKRFDQYSGGVSKDVGDALQATLAKWQDFFYGGSWPDTQLLAWETAYNKAAQTLDAAIAAGAAKQSALATAAAKSKALDAVLVTGGDPLSMPDLPLPPRWVFAAAVVPLAWLLLRGR